MPNTDRFLAPPPVIIPKGTSRSDRIKLRYGPLGPPKGSRDESRQQISGGDRHGMSNFLRTLPKK